VAANFDIGRFADDLFQACACYFPITFKPPPNDPYGVTQEGLILGLRRCLYASPHFAKPCFDLLLDKETSVLDETKVRRKAGRKAGRKSWGVRETSRTHERNRRCGLV
jgi:DNA repair/transcription protein MET18/MMS19